MAKNKTAPATDETQTEPAVHTDETPPAAHETAPVVEAADDNELVEITVAPGRTVIDADGEHGPGEKAHVTRAEAERLRAVGFAVKPEATTLAAVDG